jgi:chitodextrinase
MAAAVATLCVLAAVVAALSYKLNNPQKGVTVVDPTITVNFAPAPPTDVKYADLTSNSVILSWTASADAARVSVYNVYNGSTLVATVAETTAKVTGLTPNTTCIFTVTAKDAEGTPSQASAPLTVTTQTAETEPPTAPESLVATGWTAHTVTLSWNASTDNVGVAAYEVYTGSQSITVPGGSTTTTVQGLVPNTDYTFTVKAKDAAGNASLASNPVTLKTAATDATGGTTGSAGPGAAPTTPTPSPSPTSPGAETSGNSPDLPPSPSDNNGAPQ